MNWTTLPRCKLTPRLAGYRAGRGPRLLLVHGVGMRADFWRPLLPTLERHFSVTAVDLPGHADSPRIADSVPTLAAFGDVLAELLQESSDPSIVVGHSLGALLALDVAWRHAPYVAGIGVLNGVHRRSAEASAAVQRRAARILDATTPDNEATLERWFGKPSDGVNAVAASACRDWLSSNDRGGYHDAYQVFADSESPSDGVLRGLHVPALVMTGSLDLNSTPAMASQLCAHMPQASCHIVEGARHMLPMTHAEIVCRAQIEHFGGQGDT